MTTLTRGSPQLSLVDNEIPDPPYPPDLKAKGWKFTLDPDRIDESDTWALTPDELRPWLLMIWYRSWKQTPIGSLPDDDALIAAVVRMPLSMFAGNRAVLMRGWYRCNDGRIYHPVITELVQGMLEFKAAEKKRVTEWRISRKQQLAQQKCVTRNKRVHTSNATLQTGNEAVRTVPYATRTRTGTKDLSTVPNGTVLVADADAPADLAEPSLLEEGGGQPSEPSGSSRSCPDCPHQALIESFHAHMPLNPRVEVWGERRERLLRARWREWWDRGKYDTAQAGVAWWGRFFAYCGKSKFLTGQTEPTHGRPPFVATLDWLVRPTNHDKIIDGTYHRGGK